MRPLRKAAHVFRQELWQHRGAAHSIEARGTLAEVRAADGGITVHASTQKAHDLSQTLTTLMDFDQGLRVVAPDIGGGFGAKLCVYSEDVAVVAAAKLVGRSIKWTEDRREYFTNAVHERDQYWELEIAVDAQATVLGVRGKLLHDTGAYTPQDPNIPYNSAATMSGPYVVPGLAIEVTIAMTNKTPVSSVRGAGYPQAAFAMERLLDLVAREMGLDRAEVRRRNLIPASKMPYRKPLKARSGMTMEYDSGDYPACQDEVLKAAGWDGFAERQAQARAQGRYLGIGLAHGVKGTGRGPFESGLVRISRTGAHHRIHRRVRDGPGTRHGAGADRGEPAWCRRIEDQGGGRRHRRRLARPRRLRQPPDRHRRLIGDAGREGGGGQGEEGGEHICWRRPSTIWSWPTARCAWSARRSLRSSSPRSRASCRARRATASRPASTPASRPACNHRTDPLCYANGCHVAEVEVDVETGEVRVLRYVALQDSGVLINPMMVEGQIHGGVAHGIGNALYEWMGYDDGAQPVTTTFADYLLPTATEVPMLVDALQGDAIAAQSAWRQGRRRGWHHSGRGRADLGGRGCIVAVQRANRPLPVVADADRRADQGHEGLGQDTQPFVPANARERGDPELEDQTASTHPLGSRLRGNERNAWACLRKLQSMVGRAEIARAPQHEDPDHHQDRQGRKQHRDATDHHVTLPFGSPCRSEIAAALLYHLIGAPW